VPQEFAATAQSLYASVAIGGFSGIMALLSGYLYAGLGGAAFYAMALLTLASAGLGLALLRRWDGNELDFRARVSSAA
jgi:MFS transporter, PPP family, 3-phenylpropionic acid transporter